MKDWKCGGREVDTKMIERRVETLKTVYQGHLQIGVTTLKNKIRKLNDKKKQDFTLKLLTTGLNNMNLTTKDKSVNRNADVKRIKIGSLLDLVTQYSPNNEAVWLESCRMASASEAKQVIVRGLKAIPDSVNLWMKAAELESENVEKMRVLMKGIESNPNSIRLWKEVVGFANENDARFFLRRAVECCPLCVEFWLALACLQESFDDAKMVIDNAKEKLPKNRILVQAGIILEATMDKKALIGKIIASGAYTISETEILDIGGARVANEGLVQGDGDVANWEAIKVLVYNSCWSKKGIADEVDQLLRLDFLKL